MRTVLLLALVLTAAAGASEGPLIPRIPGSAFDYTLPTDHPVDRLIVKFAEGSSVRLRDGRWTTSASGDGGPLGAAGRRRAAEVQRQADRARDLLRQHPSAADPIPLFGHGDTLLGILKSNGERATGRQLADLGLYFAIPLAEDTAFGELEDLLADLGALEAVEVAYAEPRAEPAAVRFPASLTTPDFMPFQGYLFTAPQGIDAPSAWSHNQGRGGRGTGVRVVDVEAAWRETHEDLPPLFYQGGTEFPDPSWEHHGTAVLGEMAGADNGLGVHGIAEQAAYGVQSIFPAGVAPSILSAAAAAGEGGIVVVELQAPGPSGASSCTCNFSQCDYLPMEYWQAEFDAIATATANCVTVVEAGGNGSADLDHSLYGQAFHRGFRNSGALLVAASLATQRMRTCFSNHGSRMDFHAWGERVFSTGYGYLWAGGGPDELYTHIFSGTSSAAPIIAGAAAAVQGAQKGYGRPPLAPQDVLAVLRHGATPQAGSGAIGPMPNLRNAVSLLPYLPRLCEVYGDPRPHDEDPTEALPASLP